MACILVVSYTVNCDSCNTNLTVPCAAPSIYNCASYECYYQSLANKAFF